MRGSIFYVPALKTLYCWLVRSQLEYSQVFWSPHTKRNIDLNIECVQRRATRLILKSNSNYESRSKQLNLNSLEKRCFIGDKKILLFRQSLHLSKSWLLETKENFAKTTSFKHSYLNRIVDSWNNLGCEVSFSHDLHSLRHGVARKLGRLGDQSADGMSRSRWFIKLYLTVLLF